MIENYAVILDYLNDKIAQYWDVTLPFTVFALVIAVLIFAWRSTEGELLKNFIKNTFILEISRQHQSINENRKNFFKKN